MQHPQTERHRAPLNTIDMKFAFFSPFKLIICDQLYPQHEFSILSMVTTESVALFPELVPSFKLDFVRTLLSKQGRKKKKAR